MKNAGISDAVCDIPAAKEVASMHIIDTSGLKEKKLMKISIITPTFNSEKTVADTLGSILSQTHANYEVIVVDGGSTDSTAAIVGEFMQHFGDRLRWVSGQDKGLYDAMNKGIALATGDVVGVLNSDDFYASPRVLELVAAACGEVDAVYGDLDFVDPENPSRVVREWRGSQFSDGAFAKGWHPAHPTFYARRGHFEKLGTFDISLQVSADFELMFRFLEKHRISSRYIPEVMVKMRVGGESTGSLKKIIEGNRNVLKAFRKNGYDVPPFYLVKRLMPKFIEIVKRKFRKR